MYGCQGWYFMKKIGDGYTQSLSCSPSLSLFKCLLLSFSSPMSKLELTMNVKPSKYLQASHWRNQIWNSWGKSLHSRTAGFLPLLAGNSWLVAQGQQHGTTSRRNDEQKWIKVMRFAGPMQLPVSGHDAMVHSYPKHDVFKRHGCQTSSMLKISSRSAFIPCCISWRTLELKVEQTNHRKGVRKAGAAEVFSWLKSRWCKDMVCIEKQMFGTNLEHELRNVIGAFLANPHVFSWVGRLRRLDHDSLPTTTYLTKQYALSACCRNISLSVW